MSKVISCIDANVVVHDDGTMDCTWLTPYFGDMTPEEYEAKGTALTVRRGCEYCYAMLEWKAMLKDENWQSTVICDGVHPDWPGEWVCISQIRNEFGNLVGYEAQWKLYKSLHEVVAAGWELIWNHYRGNKRIFHDEWIYSNKTLPLFEREAV